MKVIHAELQGAVVFHVSGVAGVVTLSNAKQDKIKMRWVQGDGLYIMTPQMSDRKRVGLIPSPNVKNVEFEMTIDEINALFPDDVAPKTKIKAV